ncbi:exodeoxyribonuclease VII large subunit [Aquisalimonas sp.]|uniref:exodeoxyribonuclease VII large subunit n=1 Tax=Aquisalimonas sp. TaxID=1872621 RepID=UPI0025B97CC1|nr:exodeoxyribonuclease VII large subunit [Aquisalimonas sp.]
MDASSTTPDPISRPVLTVSRLNREVRELLEQGMPPVWVEGEISNLARPASGHLYFSLKDERAQIRCAMFRTRNRVVRFRPANGQQVLVRGRIGLYEPRGDYQLIVESMEEAGDGALRRQFEELRQKLEAEGLFAAERKKPLPELPRRIGVITSASGAAIRDVLQVLDRRFPAIAVLIYPVPVQGKEAAGAITRALRLAVARNEVDVLLLTRGGGSLEDLWAFNDETLARAIADCALPVVSAVGHEVDVTIADLVADRRAPTPSAAAELLSPDAGSWLRRFQGFGDRLRLTQLRHLQAERRRLEGLFKRLEQQHPGRRLRDHAQRLDELDTRLRHAWRAGQRLREAALRQACQRIDAVNPRRVIRQSEDRIAALDRRLRATQAHQLERRRERLAALARALEAVSPLATVSRGYAIIQRPTDGAVIRKAGDVQPGDPVTARLAQGRLDCRVETVHDQEDWT